jgi:N-acetylmuramoyl-L-alanine amidase
MIAIAWYLLKVTICSGILLGYYWLALRNKIFHHYNRFYLLCTVILSILLPFVQINFWQTHAETTNAIKVIEVVSYGNAYVNNMVENAAPIKKAFNWQLLYLIFYTAISLLLLTGFIKMLFKIRILLKKYPAQKIDQVTFVNTDNERGTPFSFLRYIFWNNQINTTTTEGHQIFKHELAHIHEKHTYDKLFINIVLIVFWFNPLFWLLRKELNLLHEFIADKKAVEDGDTSAFAAMLLQTIYPQHQFTVTNNFFYSPIKRRLIMLTKIKNPKVNYFGRILVLPLALLVLAAFTFKVNKLSNHLYNGKKITVVIDAGHGGDKDPGATNINGINEKTLALEFAKFIKATNTNNAIEIVLTREEDVYQSPIQKAAIANAKNPDLFISLHLDGGPKPNTTRSGISFWVASNQFPNTEKSKIFATSLQNEFTNNYGIAVIPEIMQREAGIWVLQNVNAPSVLLEMGFLRNETDVKYLQTQAAKEAIAKNILLGIEKYLTQKNSSINNSDTIPTQQKLPTEKDWEKAADKKIEIEKSTKVNEVKPANNLQVNISTTNDKKELADVLYIVNGFERSKNEVEKITGDKIQDVRVLKGETAVATYGEKGKKGVIIINLKPEAGNLYVEKMTVHGDASKLGAKPFIEVDGKEYVGYTFKKLMDERSENSFQTIEMFYPKDAIQKFGNKAADGAIIATTKKTNGLVEPKVAIALDKINVLYIGIDNPITIAVSGYKSEDLIVSMNNGIISGKDGKYIAHVTNTSPAEIVIETYINGIKKRLGTQSYRVKHLPDPVNGKNISDFDIKVSNIATEASSTTKSSQ